MNIPPGNKIILNIHDDDGRPGSDDLLDPAIPAVDKLLLAHAAVTGHVEDHEEIRDLLGVHPGSGISICSLPGINYIFLLVRLSFLISEERFTNSSKLIDVNGIVPRIDPAFSSLHSHKLLQLTHPCRKQ